MSDVHTSEMKYPFYLIEIPYKARLFLLAVCPTLILAGCGQQEAPPSVLANVNGEPITVEEFRYAWERNPPAVDSPKTRERVLNALIERKILTQKARDEGLENDLAVRHAYESLLVARYKERNLNDAVAKARVTDEVARVYYDRLPPEQLTEPERLRLAVLWLDSRGDTKREERYRNRLIEARLKFLQNPGLKEDASKGFGNLAIAYSDHQPTRFKGGVQKWAQTDIVQSDWWRVAIEAAKDLQEPGQVSDVVVDPAGVFLVRLIDRRQAKRREFAQVRRSLQARLTRERRHELEQSFYQSAREGRTVNTYPENLAGIEGLGVSERKSPAGKGMPKALPFKRTSGNP